MIDADGTEGTDPHVRRHAEHDDGHARSRELLAGASTRPRGPSSRRPRAARPPAARAPRSFEQARPPAPCCAGRQPGQPRRVTRTTPFTVPAGAGIDNAKATVELRVEQPRHRLRHRPCSRTPTATASRPARPRSSAPRPQGPRPTSRPRFGEPGEVIAGQEVRRPGRELPRRRRPTPARHLRGPAAVHARRPRRAGPSPASRRTGKVGATRTQSRSTAARARSIDFSKACASVHRACASPPRAAPRARASAPPGSGANAPSSARRSTARALRPQGHRPLLPEEGRRLAARRLPDQPAVVEAVQKTRKRIKSKAIYLGSTCKTFSLSKLKVGSKTKTLRKRLKGERRYRVGKNLWYVAKGKKARMLFRTRKSKVLELAWRDKRADRHQDAAPSACCARGTSAARRSQEEGQDEGPDATGVRPPVRGRRDGTGAAMEPVRARRLGRARSPRRVAGPVPTPTRTLSAGHLQEHESPPDAADT